MNSTSSDSSVPLFLSTVGSYLNMNSFPLCSSVALGNYSTGIVALVDLSFEAVLAEERQPTYM